MVVFFDWSFKSRGLVYFPLNAARLKSTGSLFLVVMYASWNLLMINLYLSMAIYKKKYWTYYGHKNAPQHH